MIDWFIALSTGEKAGVISATVGVLAFIFALFKMKRGEQNIEGNMSKNAQVQGKNNNINIS